MFIACCRISCQCRGTDSIIEAHSGFGHDVRGSCAIHRLSDLIVYVAGGGPINAFNRGIGPVIEESGNRA